MQRLPALVRILVPCILALAIVSSACTGTETPGNTTGSVLVTSSLQGAEIYLDNEYQGTTPATVAQVPAGNHTLEVREPGYERSVQSITVIAGRSVTVSVDLVKISETLPVTVRTTVTPTVKAGVPQFHVDGYWTFSRAAETENPVLLLVHTEAFNVGTTDAREVTVHAMLTYQGRTLCWDEVYLGTLKAGGHIATDTMISCNLPSRMTSSDLVVRYQDVEVTP